MSGKPETTPLPPEKSQPAPTPPKRDTLEALAAGQDDGVLVYAWELYETYSNGSQMQKNSNGGIRQRVIWLIFWTSVLAVFTTLPGVSWLLEQTAAWFVVQLNPAVDTMAVALDGEYTTWISNLGGFALSAVLIVLSVSTSALLTFASQFSPLKAWIMYRAGADRIRSEIYLYRMLAGQYTGMTANTREIRQVFLDRIESINQKIYELETAPPFLQLISEEEGSYRHSTPRIWWNRLKRLTLQAANTTGKGIVRAITPRTTEDGKKTRLSGRYFPEFDDGFNDLTVDDYIEYRIMPQRNWYVQKVYEDYEKIKDWRKVTLAIGGASAVLAAVRLEPYIVITTAAAVAVNTHIQLNLIGNTYGNYHITASRIDSAIVRWTNLTDEERTDPNKISAFVTEIESIFEDERRIWIQQASQAQQESEQTLIKGAGRRGDGVPSLGNDDNGSTQVSDIYAHDIDGDADVLTLDAASASAAPTSSSRVTTASVSGGTASSATNGTDHGTNGTSTADASPEADPDTAKG
jgi:hypothetical protein